VLLIIPNYWEKHSIIFRTSNTIFFLFLLHPFPSPSYFTFSLRVSFRCSTSVMSLWMTTSSTLLDGGIISQRGSRLAGILIYGYCMTDVPTSKTDEHWLTKHSHSSHWIFHYFFRRKIAICNSIWSFACVLHTLQIYFRVSSFRKNISL